MHPPNESVSNSTTPYSSVPRSAPTIEKDLARKCSYTQSPALSRPDWTPTERLQDNNYRSNSRSIRLLLKDGEALLRRSVPDTNRAISSTSSESAVSTRWPRCQEVQRVNANGIHRIAQFIVSVGFSVTTERERLFLLQTGNILHTNTAFDASYDVSIPVRKGRNRAKAEFEQWFLFTEQSRRVRQIINNDLPVVTENKQLSMNWGALPSLQVPRNTHHGCLIGKGETVCGRLGIGIVNIPKFYSFIPATAHNALYTIASQSSPTHRFDV